MKTISVITSKSLLLLVIMTLICGVMYPAAVTGIAQLFFSNKANGSIINVNGVNYGSSLLAQQFTEPKYLWGREMNLDLTTFTDQKGTSLMYAFPSNLSPASLDYRNLLAARAESIRNQDPARKDSNVPTDLVTVSGSGLDPDISPEAAEYQISRIAKARNISENEVRKIINEYTSERFLKIFGEKTVNVLEVNLALDGILS